MEILKTFLIGLLVLFPFLVISFLFEGLLIWILSMIFAFEFSWKLVIGIWIISAMLKGIFSR